MRFRQQCNVWVVHIDSHFRSFILIFRIAISHLYISIVFLTLPQSCYMSRSSHVSAVICPLLLSCYVFLLITSSYQLWSVVPLSAYATCPTNLILVSSVMYSHFHSCYLPGHLIRLTASDPVSPSPVVPLAQPSYPPYNFWSVSPSPVVPLAQPSRPPYNFWSVSPSHSRVGMQTALDFCFFRIENCWTKFRVEALAKWYLASMDLAS